MILPCSMTMIQSELRMVDSLWAMTKVVLPFIRASMPACTRETVWAWEACLWARLGDGERALKLLKNQLRVTKEETCSLVGGGIYPNMLCAHPPFQIDGNFGFAAAVLEMLVQYQDDRIFFLPALPTEWKDGKISGLRAPGGITIDFVWKDRCITECSLRSQTDTVRTLLYNGTEKKVMLKTDVICHIV